jgi:general secretion pathway protein K
VRSPGTNGMIRNDRGVALLVTLLVTTLLMALVFEFAYGTRVSLRSAVNFRDSQRAYFLLRSGIALLAKFPEIQNEAKQGEWTVVPVISQGDTVVRVKWEDEAGKINIADLRAGQQSLARLEELFGIEQVSLEVLERLKERKRLMLPGELHQLMEDEDFGKIIRFVTVWSGSDSVNVNTAPSEVLQSLGISAGSADLIFGQRQDAPFTNKDDLTSYGINSTALGSLVLDSTIYTVHCEATVGGYTKVAEAVIKRSSPGYSVLYWRIL